MNKCVGFLLATTDIVMRSVAAASVLVVISAVAAPANAVTVFFGPPDFVWNAANNSPNHIFETGDSWSQTFTGTGLASVGSLSLSLTFDANQLAPIPGTDLNMAANINGQQVGTFSIAPLTATLAISFSGFGPISGPAYDISLVELNTIPSSRGSVSLQANGSSSSATLSGTEAATPLPAALPLFASGLGALGLLGWRRKRKARVSLLGAA